ncbi:MAG: hypothetical protein RSB81_01000 [Anaerovoracaceae bacterium]
MNSKGNTMVEATLVFPLVILAVISIIYILVALYTQVYTQAQMHIALREESGIQTKTVEYLGEVKADFPITKANGYVYYQGELKLKKGGVLDGIFSRELSGRCRLNQGRMNVRIKDLL